MPEWLKSFERGVPNGIGGSQRNRGTSGDTPLPAEKGVPNRTAAEQCGMILDGFCSAHQLNGDKVREEYFAAGGKAIPDMLRAWLQNNYGAGKAQ